MFTKEVIEQFYQENLQYKREQIYNYLDKLIDKTKSKELYCGMLLSLSLMLILKDSLSNQMIFSGIHSIWMRNAALIIFDRILAIESAAEDENFFNSFEDLDEI